LVDRLAVLVCYQQASAAFSALALHHARIAVIGLHVARHPGIAGVIKILIVALRDQRNV
jgi:hypothetical protein